MATEFTLSFMTRSPNRGQTPFFGILAALLLLSGCQPVEAERLYALTLAGEPDDGTWAAAVPLGMKAGGGYVNGKDQRLADLERDTDPVHGAAASCHHGPPVTDVVLLEARAFAADGDLHLEVRWDDPTHDTDPRSWKKEGGVWGLDEKDEDGVAILWSRVAGPFGCQEACHMSDFALRQGELIDLRSMRMAEEGEWEEAWVWKPSHGAQALILGREGFFGAGDGKIFRRLNSAVAADPALRPEARRAGTFGEEDRPLVDGEGKNLREGVTVAPAYLYEAEEVGGGLSARAERWRKGWRVVFSRTLEAGEGRQSFVPGESYRFGVALFDGTSTDHHIVRDTQTLELRPAAPPSPPDREDEKGEVPGESRGIL